MIGCGHNRQQPDDASSRTVASLRPLRTPFGVPQGRATLPAFGLKGRFYQPRPYGLGSDSEEARLALKGSFRTTLSGSHGFWPKHPGLRPGLTEAALQAAGPTAYHGVEIVSFGQVRQVTGSRCAGPRPSGIRPVRPLLSAQAERYLQTWAIATGSAFAYNPRQRLD
jgi:hypothetical protein